VIVADTSAFVAIIFGEDDADRFAQAMASADDIIIGAPTALELNTVLFRKGGVEGLSKAAYLLSAPKLRIASWDASHLPMAVDALRRFGGRPARLNFGGCMAYAIAKALDAPLLYKGEDFARTDIRSAS